MEFAAKHPDERRSRSSIRLLERGHFDCRACPDLIKFSSAVNFSKTNYTGVDQAAFAGYCEILRTIGSGVDQKEYSFVVILQASKPVAYKYSIPEGGTNSLSSFKADTSSGNLKVRAFCHTHPKSDRGDFGGDDKDHFRNAIKDASLQGIAFYLMNTFREVRIARALDDFPQGKPTSFKSDDCPK